MAYNVCVNTVKLKINKDEKNRQEYFRNQNL